MMEQKPSAFKALRILYFGLLVGMLTFMGISYFISTISEPPVADRDIYKILSIILLVVSFVLVISANLLKRDLSRIKNLESLNKKMEQYRAAAIRTWAMIEGVALLSTIFFFLTHHSSFLVFNTVLILVYLLQNPTANKVALQVGESPADIAQL